MRGCLHAVKPDLDLSGVRDDTPLLEQRIITSFQVLDLLLHLEHLRGAPIDREQLQPGSLRDVATIARVFLGAGGG